MITKEEILAESGVLNEKILTKITTVKSFLEGGYSGKCINPPNAEGKKIVSALKAYNNKMLSKGYEVVKNLRAACKDSETEWDLIYGIDPAKYISLTPNKIYLTKGYTISSIGVSKYYSGLKRTTLNGQEIAITYTSTSKEKTIDCLKDNYCICLIAFYKNKNTGKVIKKKFI